MTLQLSPEKLKQIEILKNSLNKKHGSGSVRILGGEEVVALERYSTGIPAVDWATGGGYPKGRFIEIFGPESSGKTTLTLHAIAEAQKAGDLCAFIDAEHALDIAYARALGVDTDALLISQPSTAEEALDIVEELVLSGLFKFIVVDSVAALVPRAELEADSGAQLPGLQARLMSQACRKLTGPAYRNKVTVFWINQIRYKIGVLFGSPETTAGGNALKFYASIRIDIRKRGQIKVGEVAVANDTELKVIKNKTAPPYRVAEFVINYGTGVDKDISLVRLALELKIIDKAGAWYKYEGANIGQGEANTIAYLNEHPEVKLAIIEKIKPTKLEPVIEAESED
jgi:recombination protein RecA